MRTVDFCFSKWGGRKERERIVGFHVVISVLALLMAKICTTLVMLYLTDFVFSLSAEVCLKEPSDQI